MKVYLNAEIDVHDIANSLSNSTDALALIVAIDQTQCDWGLTLKAAQYLVRELQFLCTDCPEEKERFLDWLKEIT